MTMTLLQNHATLRLPDGISGWGQDEYSIFIEFSLSTGDKNWDYIDQRLRWIPPGRFTMGSPDDEGGQLGDDAPQHTVTIRNGFWMMDTPVTQQLWQHVMENNPSEFVDPERPVEQVDWHQATAFCQKLSGLLKATIQLPSEAQWEYACRAGTETATYAGPMKIIGEHNAPVLHEIAWYGGNSGRDFDLPNGLHISDWPERQFEDRQAGTRKVAKKNPNPWGLYDMLGNVWEWCRDGQRRYFEVSVVDPLGSTEDSALRVLRGGSWRGRAQSVRAASRFADDPGYRCDSLGFRCVWVPSP